MYAQAHTALPGSHLGEMMCFLARKRKVCGASCRGVRSFVRSFISLVRSQRMTPPAHRRSPTPSPHMFFVGKLHY